jgi:hypothetical protein
MNPSLTRIAAGFVAVALLGTPLRAPAADAVERAPASFVAPKLDPALAMRLLALDCTRISADDVRALAQGPTPRIIMVHGGIFPVHLVMASFGRFLAGMGYPESRIRDSGGDWSYSPYMDTKQLAGLVAWQYERDGMRPLLIGHSQGGLYVVKIIKDLAGQTAQSLQVWNPRDWAFENRTTIVDPLTGRTRPVIGVSVAYGSAIGAGGLALILPNQWEPLETLRKIPDTIDEFTGYFINSDLIAMSFPGNPLDSRYQATGTATVRNVMLPPTYNHISAPDAEDLAKDAQVRAWIDAYVPKPGADTDADADTSSLPAAAQQHALYAADVWYSVKKSWCQEAQRLIRRGSAPPAADVGSAPPATATATAAAPPVAAGGASPTPAASPDPTSAAPAPRPANPDDGRPADDAGARPVRQPAG